MDEFYQLKDVHLLPLTFLLWYNTYEGFGRIQELDENSKSILKNILKVVEPEAAHIDKKIVCALKNSIDMLPIGMHEIWLLSMT